MVAGVAPARGHPDVEELVLKSGGFCNIFKQTNELSEIHVDKAAGIDGACDAIFYFFAWRLILVCFEDLVPNVQQVTKVGVHVQGIAGVVNPVMGRREDDPAHKAHATVLHDIFSYVDKSAPCAVDGHDEKKEGRVYACEDADGGPDHVCVGSFHEKMHVGDGEVHGLWCVVCRVEAPEQAYFMSEIVIDEMSEFPDDVSIDEPVPGETGGEDGVFFEKADAKGDCCYGDEAGNEPVGYEDEERHAVIFDPEALVGYGASYLYQQEKRDDGGDGCKDPMGCGQGGVVIFMVHFQQGPQAGETKQFVI